jgi:hypothetical protein
MLPGYNHNVRYKDQVFHIQTEDSGVQNPHIITHVFVGGNIVESRKTSYADIVNSERLPELLVDLMQDQHKHTLKDLISGRLDHRIVERSAGAGMLNGPAPLNVDAGAQHRVSLFAGAPGAGPASPAAKPAAPPPAPRATPPAAAKPAPLGVPPPAPPPAKAPVVPPPAKAPPAAAPPRAPVPRPPAQPPAPASIFGDVPSSFFGDAPPADRVIAAETLAKAFESKNESAVDSIFGEDLISEKSLDEVILSYLAEDMQK